MSLPILQYTEPPTTPTLLRYFQQTEIDWARHLGEETQLDIGLAIRNADLPRVHDANKLLDMRLLAGISPEQAIATANQHFGGTCQAYLPTIGTLQDSPLLSHLRQSASRRETLDILYLRAGKPLARTTPPGLTILPARASYRHARQIAEEMTSRWAEPQLVDAQMLHLDDPHVDSLIAMEGGNAVATISVLAVGEIGRIENVYIAESHRRRGIGKLMMSRALEICARSVFRHIFISVTSDNQPARSLYQQCGFEKIGAYEEFVTA